MNQPKRAEPAPLVRAASGQFMVARSLADPAVAEQVAAVHAQITSSKAEAVKFLKQVGVLNRSGKLAKEFRR
jgi:hypothetical protein